MKKGMGWPIGVVVILGATVAANIVVMRLANDDPAFAIEPDYYKKAVAFDSTLAEEQRSLALGWTATSSLERSLQDDASTLTVVIADAQKQPVSGATVTVVALANVRANDRLTASLREMSAGRYQAELAVRFAGEWEVRVDAVRGAEHFVASTRTDVSRARSGLSSGVLIADSVGTQGTPR